ncbi:polar amino acid transport system permease protein [Pseudochelatococcus lubricantis]|uniref:Polar amino acid transport system permease protein n=1 Tax=Pseudochelatococcus lubricantis TaxID=1538102 RepID=A0ABX0UXD7_9HYPH|nr:amino acid ABC transporter permease [Pseudochelatococcus lubricantis]NIJ57601.1 polar amino acid transport system permease protein [Pseudochelatococcus lubricantis]
MNYEWDFAPVFRNIDLLVQGAYGTFVLVALSLAVALPLGLVLALLRMSRIPVVGHLAGCYVEIFRSAPAIVLIYWFFFAFPMVVGLRFSPTTAAVLAVGLQSAAFFCEVFRAGIGAVPRGQWEAASALGMRKRTLFVSIILPQAVRNMLPIFLNRLIDVIKTTALASIIAYGEIVYQASQISSRTYRPIETYTVLGGIFFVVIFIISLISRQLERRLQRAHAR